MKNSKLLKDTKPKITLQELLKLAENEPIEHEYYNRALAWLFDPQNKPAIIELYSDFLLLDKKGLKTDNYKNIETLEDFKIEAASMLQALSSKNSYPSFLKIPKHIFGKTTTNTSSAILKIITNELAEYYDHDLIVMIDAYNRVRASDTLLRENISYFNQTLKKLSEGSYIHVV